MDPRVSVPVGNEQLARSRMNSNVGRTIEHTTALPFTRFTLSPQRKYYFAIVSALLDDMPIVVDEKQIIVRVDLYTVRSNKRSVSHASDKITFGIEYCNGVSTPVENVDIVM